MAMMAADEWHGFDPDTQSFFGRLIDEDGWLYRIETDGQGRTLEVRDHYIGRGFFVNGLRERHAQIEERSRKAREAHPDPRASVLKLIEDAPRTSRELGKLIGQGQQTVTDILGGLRREGLVEWEYAGTRGNNATEHLWSLTEDA